MSVKGKAHACPIEDWEVELAKNIARSFAGFPEWNDLEAELFRKLSVMKSGEWLEVIDWKAFLAKSLFNAAHDYLRRWKVGARLFVPMESPGNDGRLVSLEEIIAHPGDLRDSGIDIRLAVECLSPELQQLWALLMEEGGNQVRVAERLGKPRMTVKYRIDKLKSSLAKRGFNGEK